MKGIPIVSLRWLEIIIAMMVVEKLGVNSSFRLQASGVPFRECMDCSPALANLKGCGTVVCENDDGLINMQNTKMPSSEAAIVGRLIKPDHGDFSPEAARELLSLQFGEEDQARMRELSLKAQEGTLSATDQVEIENYRRVGYWLGILWSKARLSLKRAGTDATHESRA